MRTKQFGFSLIELMIVVAIIGIIASIAYPSYTQYVLRTNRTDAMETLTEIMNQQQRYVLRQRRYAVDLSDLGYAAATVQSERRMYTIAAAACPGSTIQRCVLLTATPMGPMVGDGDITLDSRGEKKWGTEDGWYHK